MLQKEKSIIIENYFLPLYIDWKAHCFAYEVMKYRGDVLLAITRATKNKYNVFREFSDLARELGIFPPQDIMQAASEKAESLVASILDEYKAN